MYSDTVLVYHKNFGLLYMPEAILLSKIINYIPHTPFICHVNNRWLFKKLCFEKNATIQFYFPITSIFRGNEGKFLKMFKGKENG